MTDLPSGRRVEAWRPTLDLATAALMLVLAFIGIAASDVSGSGSQTWWSLLAIVFGLICLGLDWVHEPYGTHWWKAALRTVVHWFGVLLAIELVYILIAAGRLTKHLCKMDKGDWIGIRGPFGKPFPVKLMTGNDLLFVAGGIGLAPLRSLINYVIDNRREFGKVDILLGCKTPTDMLFGGEIKDWQKRLDVNFSCTVDRSDPDWKGRWRYGQTRGRSRSAVAIRSSTCSGWDVVKRRRMSPGTSFTRSRRPAKSVAPWR